MPRALLALSPWLFLGGCAAFVTGLERVPDTVTVGYELHFQDLWEPVMFSGLLVMAVTLPLASWGLVRSAHPVHEALRNTRTAKGPVLLLVAALALLLASHVAHREAVTRSEEAMATWMARLHDQTPPPRTAVWFQEPWRGTADLGRALYLAAACCFVGWLGLRAWCASRAVWTGSGDSPVD